MHFCVNVVCLGEEGSASAVLLRAGRVIAGEELACARRTRGTTAIAARDLAPGPAPLRLLSGPGTPARSALLASGDGHPATPRRIVTGPRVGVSSAAEIPWRFWY